ncbi:MAG TPA: amidohydrolase family protein, partial [Puia sp.]|nr:amidohydrolase family protein [Puia sp.]
MGYRKFRADYLFEGHRRVSGDPVLILSHDGIVQEIVPAAEAGEGIETYSGTLCPGFVNCHCHLELSWLKGRIPEGTGLVDFLLAVIGQRGRAQPDAVAAAIAAAEEEMAAGGIVAVGDICNTTDTLELKKSGRLAYYNFIETMGFTDRSAPDRFGAALAIFTAFENQLKDTSSIVPHAPYSVSANLFGVIARFAEGRLLTMHSQETAAENEFYLSGQGDFLRLYQGLGLDISAFRGTGKRSLASVLEYFPPEQP